MNVPHSFGLKGVLQFKEQEFEFKPGLSVVYGLNRAAGKHSKNSNGAGKSLFFSQIPELLYDDTVVGEKSDLTREGTRYLRFKSADGKKVELRQESHGKSSKLRVMVNGKDKGLLTSSKAKAALSKYWPITQDEFNTYVYIDSRVPHPLVMGSSTERKRFFTSFFGLDRMDAERKVFQGELNKLKQVRSAFDELRAQYMRTKEDLLTPNAVSVVEHVIEKIGKKLKSLNKEAAEGQEVIRLLQFVANAKEQVQALGVALNGEWTHESYELAVADNRKQVKRARSDLADARAWEDYVRDASQYTKAVEDLSKRTKKLIDKLGFKKAQKLARKRNSEFESLCRAHAGASSEKLKQQIKALREQVKDKPERPDVDRGELETLIRAYSHQLEHARKFKSGNCETCGSVVKIKDPEALKDKIKKARSKLARHDEADAWDDAKSELKQLKAALVKAEEFEAEYERLEPYSKIAEELANLPRAPEPFEGKKLQVKVMERVWDEVNDRKRLLEFFQPHLDTVISVVALTAEQKAKARRAQELHKEINDLQERLSKKQAELEVHKTVKRRCRDMKARLLEMKEQLKEEAALKELVAGYADKNLKRMAVEAISTHLMAKVNEYARHIPGDYRFSFEWGTKIRMLVHRKEGKKSIVSDVRKLSGAESKLFTLSLVLALMSFVPSHKRSSVLILDEPTANFSEESTESFKELLKVISTVVPTIILITPRSSDRYEGAHEFTVVKSNGVSRIESGHPSNIRSTQ